MVIRLLTLVRWILVLPAAVVGTGVSRMEQRTQLPSGKQWLQRQPIQLRLWRPRLQGGRYRQARVGGLSINIPGRAAA